MRSALRIVFHVPKNGTRQTVTWVKAEKSRTNFVRVKGVNWYTFPLWLYRTRIDRHSRPGAKLVHTFLGTEIARFRH